MSIANETTNANPEDKRAYRGYIKDVLLELPEYKFRHGSTGDDEDGSEKDDDLWVGRKEIQDKLHSYLADGDSGAYLVTGYRGMGKTSFVRRTIKRYKTKEAIKQKRSVKTITISFGQKDVREIDVLRQMIKGLMDNILINDLVKFLHEKVFSFNKLPIWAGTVFLLLIAIDCHIPFFDDVPYTINTPADTKIEKDKSVLDIYTHNYTDNNKKSLEKISTTDALHIVTDPLKVNMNVEWADHETMWKKLQSPHGFEIGGALLVLSVMIAFVLLSWFTFLFRSTFSTTRFYDELQDLYDRCRSQITKEDGGSSAGEKFPLGLVDKMVKSFPIANPKEMENEVIEILDRYNIQTENERGISFKYVSFALFSLSAITLLGFIGAQKNLLDWTIKHINYKYVGIEYWILMIAACVVSIIIRVTSNESKRIQLTVKNKKSRIVIAFLLTLFYGVGYLLLHINIYNEICVICKPNRSIFSYEHLHSLVFVMICVMATFLITYIIYNIVSIRNGLFHARKFIFIFDEIDKVDPSQHQENYHDELDRNTNAMQYDMRERRKVVINILANLKYLITTAKAKFVFIAGQEMFDAALADVADRQSAISSIFHEIIYVDSFLKDRSVGYKLNKKYEKTMGLSMLVEDYLERIMIPSWAKEDKKNGEDDKTKIKEDNSFVRNYYCFLKQQSEKHNQLNLSEHSIRSVIYTLQNLIVYLTYRSNGSPKKLIRLIEELIKIKGNDTDQLKLHPDSKEDNKEIVITTVRNNMEPHRRRYYLHINYNTHYRIGLINYIYRSFLSVHGDKYKQYSDKILVSTPFLLDHIIKFHPFAFSLQNLELVPEVVSETRSPELRFFIEQLIIHLSQNHVRHTETPLFDYKFSHRSFYEINFLSKIFESESAAFNFTLDENYPIKQHIQRKIKDLRNTYKDFVDEKGLSYIKSITFLNEQAGNLHFYDDEYDDAIISYQDAIQPIEQHLNSQFNYEILISYVTLKLKLGLCYEKIKDYKSASAIYAEPYMRVCNFLLCKKKSDNTNLREPGWEMDIIELTCFALIAGLYLQEKVDSVSTERIEMATKSVSTLIMSVRNELVANDTQGNGYVNKQECIINARIFSGIGTLFFYKNSSAENENNSCVYVIEFKKIVEYEKHKSEKNKGFIRNDFRTSANTYKYLKKNLESLLNYNLSFQSRNIIVLLQNAEVLINSFTGSKESDVNTGEIDATTAKHDSKHAEAIAAAINKLADCLYSNINSSSNSIEIDSKYLPYSLGKNNDKKSRIIHWTFTNKDFNHCLEKEGNISKDTLFRLVLTMYYQAGELYLRIGRNMEGSFSFLKILQAFRLLAHRKTVRKYNTVLSRFFLNRILQITSWNSNSSDRYQVKKYEYAFGERKNNRLEMYNIMSTSGSSELREALILFSELRLKTLDIEELPLPEEREMQQLITQYNTIPTQTVRYHELRLQVALNSREVLRLFKKIEPNKHLQKDDFFSLSKSFIENLQPDVTEHHLSILRPIIANSIYCLYQIISIYRSYGLNYWMSYSSLGKYHEMLGNWLALFEFYKRNEKPRPVISNLLAELLGMDIVRNLDSISEYNKALQHYSRAKQLHNDGAPYKQLTVNMYYLEDDFTDSIYLFGMAVERQKINSGRIRADIIKLKAIVDNHHENHGSDFGHYDYGYYVNKSRI